MVMTLLTDVFYRAIPIIDNIEKYNHQAYFVGGCVRDLLLNRPIGDIDITTSAPPTVIQDIFDQVIPVGIEHGTVIVRYHHTSYEVTTFRIDGEYSDQRHPDSVQFIGQIEQDLQRRDFTINALAMDRNGHIIDLFKGQEDLQNQLLRTVGDGYHRFTEDPLRIIRALRFSSQLGFRIDDDTLNSMIEVKKQIETVAMERITNEFTKLFAGDYVNNGIYYLIHTKVYEHLPILKGSKHIIHGVAKLTVPFKSFSGVLALFHHLDPSISIQTWVKEWKCSNKIKNETIDLVNALKYYKQASLDPWLVYQLPDHLYSDFVRLIHHVFNDKEIALNDLINLNQKLPIHSKREMAISGHELIQLFPQMKKGPWIHRTLQHIEKEIVLDRLDNTTDAIKEWITCNPPETN